MAKDKFNPEEYWTITGVFNDFEADLFNYNNKDIEIKSDVLLTQNARTILNQAKNGVYVRMAILDMILASKGL